MNFRSKFIFSIGLLSLVGLLLPGSLLADIGYTYTGNAYDHCYGSYCTGGPYALSVTFDVMAGTPLDNLTLYGAGSDITADVTSFSFTDRSGLNINKGNAGAYSFKVGTDATGNIFFWNLSAGCNLGLGSGPVPCVTTVRDMDLAQDLSEESVATSVNPLGYSAEGFNRFDRGSWAPPVTSTPEPSSYFLLGTVILGLALAARGKRHAPPI